MTKNALTLRDFDILRPLAEHNLVSVALSLTTLNEDLRLVLELRTVTARQRLRTIAQLHEANVPVGANHSRFGTRMSGEGVYARQIREMHRLACAHLLTGKTQPALGHA